LTSEHRQEEEQEKDRESVQEIESSLKENFKLSGYEARTYLSLLRLGKLNTKQISASADIPLPRVYDTIESLMTKGFIVQQESGSFSPIPPRIAMQGRTSQFEVQFSEDQKRRRKIQDRLVAELSRLEPSEKSRGESEISILKGFNTIANKFADLIQSSTDVILVAKRAVEARDVFIPIILEFAGGAKKNKERPKGSSSKRIRIITPKTTNVTKEELASAKKSGAEIRRSDSVLFDMMITDTDDILIGVPDPLSEEINHAIAIWVRNTSFAKSTRASIEEMWKTAERI
jgi:sugar-specific transcriptional regulator TrmB